MHLYGTPTHDSYSVKVACDPQWSAIADPDEIPAFERNELRKVGEWAARYLPDLNPELVRHFDAPRSVCPETSPSSTSTRIPGCCC